MASVVDVFRVLGDRRAWYGATLSAARLKGSLSGAHDVVRRCWYAVGEDLPDLEDEWRRAHRDVETAVADVHVAFTRLRYLTG